MRCTTIISALFKATRTLRSASQVTTRALHATSLLQHEMSPSPPLQLTQSYVHAPGSMPYIGATIGESLLSTVEKTPDQESLVFCDAGIRLTFAEFMKKVDQFAASLHNLGLRKGDRIGIWGPSTVEWVITQFATARLGLLLVNINPAYQMREVEYALRKTGTKAIVSAVTYKTQKYYQMLSEISPELLTCSPGKLKSKKMPDLTTVIMMGTESLPGTFNFEDVMEIGTSTDVAQVHNISRSLDFDEPINIQFTSGTTGFPKGATLSHHNIMNNIRCIGMRIGFDDYYHRICCQVPLYHCFGMVGGTMACSVFGMGVIFPCAGYDPVATLRSLQEEKCSVIYGTPTMFIDGCNHPDMSKYDYSSVEKGIMAGSPCPPEVVLAAEKTFSCRILNVIQEIQDEVFKPLGNLLVLNLQSNKLISLGDNTFTGLSKLKVLTLSNNVIQHISTTTFFPLRNLRKLFLDNNKLSVVPEQAFSGGVLFKLLALSLRKNEIQTVEERAFSSLRSITFLSLSNNSLRKIAQGAFDGLPKLRSLQLMANELKYLPDLSPMTGLNKFGVSGNPWKCDCRIQDFRRWLETTAFDLTCDSPSYMNGKSFRSLDIEDLICEETEDPVVQENNNDLDATSEHGMGGDKVVSPGQFVCPDQCNCDGELKHVNCDNQGYTSPPVVLEPTTALLDLRRNRIKILPMEGFTGLTSLISLHLQFNKIREVESRAFEGLHNLIYLYLEDNEISILYSDSFQGLPSLAYLFLDRNFLTTLPSRAFQPLSSAFSIFIRNNRLESLSEDNLYGLGRLRWLYLSGNRLSAIKNNTFRGTTDIERLYFDNNDLTAVPFDALSDLSSLVWLDLSRNLIDSLPARAFQSHPHLEKLYLGENQMYSADTEAFLGLYNLQVLNISNNILETIPPISSSRSLQEIRLGNNLWRCDCEFLPFHNWLRDLTDISNPGLTFDPVVCSTPLQLKHTDLLSISEEKLCHQ